LFAHVDLYVNDWTLELGVSGEQALAAMHQLAIERGVLPASSSRLCVWSKRTTASTA
jgi:predicted solute-binding protein